MLSAETRGCLVKQKPHLVFKGEWEITKILELYPGAEKDMEY